MPEGARLTANPRFANRDYVTEENWSRVERIREFAQARGVGMLEVAFGWLAARPPTASVIAGATSPEQIDANAAAVDWRPSPEEVAELDAITG
jgi:aryl-alcohol dehydrogenase-like predicted oxidoreductase